MPVRLTILWCCLVLTAGIGGFAAGRLDATLPAPDPVVVPDTAGRVPVITLKRAPDGIEARVEAAEARFIVGGRTLPVPPGTSTIISLP